MNLENEEPIFETYSTDQGLQSQILNTILLENDSTVWCGSPQGASLVLFSNDGRLKEINNYTFSGLYGKILKHCVNPVMEESGLVQIGDFTIFHLRIQVSY